MFLSTNFLVLNASLRHNMDLDSDLYFNTEVPPGNQELFRTNRHLY